MRVGIYNRWLATLGGGEKYVLTIADHLSKKHQVEVLSHSVVDKAFAANRLNLDLSKVEFKVLPEMNNYEISWLTKQYDFFICGSYQDFFPSYAPISATVIFFPTPADGLSRYTQQIKRLLQKGFDIPRIVISPQDFNLSRGMDGWQANSMFEMQLPVHSTAYYLSFDLELVNCQLDDMKLSLNGNELAYTDQEIDGVFQITLEIPGTDQEEIHRLQVICDFEESLAAQSPRIHVNNIRIHTARNRIYSGAVERFLQSIGIYIEYSPQESNILNHLDTYDAIWTISKFSQKWAYHYWNRPTRLLFPPTNVDSFSVGHKTNNILNVGRFFAGQHNKKHAAMITAFKKMVDHGLKDWTLNLVGGQTPGQEHEKYLRDLYQQAEGYPICIHPDLPYEKLLELYATSMIYWHASGYGENEKRAPEKLEHFGITTVEGMASGCVPVVINKGGQPEIVQHQVNGFLWNNLNELERYTLQVIRDENLQKRLSAQAVIDSRLYDYQHFIERVDELCDEIGIPG